MATKRSVRSYPNDQELQYCRDIVKPPGLLSNNYTKEKLKKVDRKYISAKDATSTDSGEPMYQVDYRSPDESSQSTSYFNTTTKRSTQRDYDRINNATEGYNSKLHRDDRIHAKSRGLFLHEEEIQRPVFATSNAVYGNPRLSHLERILSKQPHGHIKTCQQEFYRINGINTHQTGI